LVFGSAAFAPAAGAPAGGAPTASGTIGPDLQGLADPFPFHPTGTGSLRTAAAVARLIAPDADGN